MCSLLVGGQLHQERVRGSLFSLSEQCKDCLDGSLFEHQAVLRELKPAIGVPLWQAAGKVVLVLMEIQICSSAH